ncbi:DsbA family protein [Jannaschia donghaensis]|uniref:Thiol-disulfide oxidoreductase D n=1 Tax=Jannaschia donghaensis TaxID=420998 RepID=A0A0M6YG79_9RHOB|nr:DsbA family protein [Jannaschia donghaensis]CTQ49358.1 Thiol-disulfide oxidoreductase D [Jannaschia donghaensis]
MITRRKALTLAGIGLVAGGGFTLLRGGDTGGVAGLADFGAANAQGTSAIEDVTLGDADAPVKVVEYASYTCPHCASFHNDTFKQFKADYIDSGKVHFTYREVFFDRYGLWAAMVARCAGNDRYFGVADLLYQKQGEWARQTDAASVAESLKRIGALAGLSQDTVDACLQDAAKAQSLVAWWEENSESDNVRSTPSFLINGDMHTGNMSLDQIGALVDEAAG